MTRRKNHKRSRFQHNVEDTRDKTCLISNSPIFDVQDINHNTPDKIPAEIIQKRTPECTYFVSSHGNELGSDIYSPKFIPRVPKLKLNLDIPENESDPEDNECKVASVVNSKTERTEQKQSTGMINC